MSNSLCYDMADISFSSPAKCNSPSIVSNINHLSDDVLGEIFIRLSYKSTAKCKCVCKRWLRLISNPSFPTQLVSHQHSLFKAFFTYLSPHQLIFTFLPKYFDFNNAQTEKTLLSPEILIKGNVCGYSDGLFLCCSNRYTSGLGYFVYDPFTKECTHIPPFPGAGRKECLYAVGFNSETEDSVRRFWVIVVNSFIKRTYEFKVRIFCSEAGVWKQRWWRCIEGFAFAPHWLLGVAYLSKLYFMGTTNIFMVDVHLIFPDYNIIDYPEGCDAMNIMSFGHLGCSDMALKIADINHNDLTVWKLIWKGEHDHGTVINLYKTWDLVHTINLSAHLSPKFCGNYFKRVAGFHPSDEDIVYLHSYADGVFVANLRTNKFEHVSGYDKFDISPFQLDLTYSSPIPFTDFMA